MQYEAKIAYYAFDVIQFFVPYAARCLLSTVNLYRSPAARTGCAVHFSLFSRVTLTDEVSGQAQYAKIAVCSEIHTKLIT